MKNLTLIGDPVTINNNLAEVYNHNPKMKVISMAACMHFLPPQKSIVQSAAQNNNPIPVNVLYITFDGPNLVDGDGKEMPGQ